MNYVKQILFPDEKVLYDGRVHPRVLAHGLMYLAASALAVRLAAHTGGGNSPLLNWLQSMAAGGSSFFRTLFGFFYGWQVASPDVSLEFKLIALAIALLGIKHFIAGILLMRSTELVVTDIRIIAKTGILNVLTLEMDRRRVAEVLIDQSVWGRMFNYGHIYIRGFTGVIGGMPVMVNPHLIERYVNMRY